jgi:hypothetical protein
MRSLQVGARANWVDGLLLCSHVHARGRLSGLGLVLKKGARRGRQAAPPRRPSRLVRRRQEAARVAAPPRPRRALVLVGVPPLVPRQVVHHRALPRPRRALGPVRAPHRDAAAAALGQPARAQLAVAGGGARLGERAGGAGAGAAGSVDRAGISPGRGVWGRPECSAAAHGWGILRAVERPAHPLLHPQSPTPRAPSRHPPPPPPPTCTAA